MNIETLSGLSILNTFNNYGGTSLVTGKDKLREDILLLLTQNKFQFTADPDFGSTINSFLFEAATEENANAIQLAIIDAISTAFPSLILQQVNIKYFMKGYSVTIVYSETSDGTSSSIDINLLTNV